MREDPALQKALAEQTRLAIQFHTQGKLAEAIRCYQDVLAIKPVFPHVHHNLGLAWFAQGKIVEAIAQYQSAIQQKPDYAAAYNNLGIACKANGELDAAIASYAQAIKMQPRLVDAYSNLGNALCARGDLQEAVAQCRHAIRLDPAFAPAHNNLGNALRALHNHAQALLSYQRALQLKPDYAEAQANAGHLFQDQGDISQALSCYEKALQLQQDYPEAYSNRFYLHLNRCDWSNHATRRATIVTAVTARTKGYGTLPFLAVSDSALLQQRCAQTHVRHNHPAVKTPLATGGPYSHRKIRLVYMSADFRDHAASYLMAGLFAAHDREKFDVIALSLSAATNTELAQRVKNGFDRFIDVSGRTDTETAQLIRELETDILVDLMGFTQGCRPNVLARRPAPIQINYLGFPATMGTDYMDYIIADPYLIPPHLQGHYSEKVAWLPDCFQVNDAQRFRPNHKPERAHHNLPASGFVFCCFNNSYKISPLMFDCWMRLLAKVPGSVLWLIANDQKVQRALRNEAGKRHIAPERLIFAGRIPYADYLTRFQLADLFLDTFPFNAGTTASDALWAGVPVLTCSGEAFASRMAGSLLTAIGLPELITTSMKTYEELACKLAADPALLSLYRDRLAAHRSTHALFDTKRFCKNFEAALTAMMATHQQGKPAGSFAVETNGSE